MSLDGLKNPGSSFIGDPHLPIGIILMPISLKTTVASQRGDLESH
jgi:hypothetical protein